MLEVTAPHGIGEIAPGEDLTEVLLHHADLRDGDIVVVTSKVVSKAEGRVRRGDSAESLAEETQRIVARTGSVTIVRGRLGLTHAMAGLDASNVPSGSHILLPEDPDRSARALREAVREATGLNIAVLVSDTAGRAWRLGQTEIAIGAAGLAVMDSYVGAEDGYGNVLRLTLPCVADELCCAAELVSGKTTRRPFAIIRGRADLVCDPDVVGDGASSIIRPPEQDLFGFGAREAVVRALAQRPSDQSAYGDPSSAFELARAVEITHPQAQIVATDDDSLVVAGISADRTLTALAFAFGWAIHDSDARGIRLVRISP